MIGVLVFFIVWGKVDEAFPFFIFMRNPLLSAHIPHGVFDKLILCG